MRKFHIDEPREIGKKRIRVSKNDLMAAKDELSEIVVRKKIREMVKKELTEETAVLSKSEIKKMERVSEKLIKDLETFLKVWKKKHKVSVSDSVLYDTSKEWEQAIRNLSMKFGGWFGFVYDSDYIK
jgi:hypothetical protein|tara:strand:+ start:637 stop:1017 length:381 start_codon:yes stop_codon:yes gene_type:complete